MKDRQIIRVILLGVVAIMGLVGIQTYWVTASWRLNQAEFDEKIHRVLLKVARAMAQLNSAELPQRDLIKKRSSNYFVVNVDNEIDPQMLEFFLQKNWRPPPSISISNTQCTTAPPTKWSMEITAALTPTELPPTGPRTFPYTMDSPIILAFASLPDFPIW